MLFELRARQPVEVGGRDFSLVMRVEWCQARPVFVGPVGGLFAPGAVDGLKLLGQLVIERAESQRKTGAALGRAVGMRRVQQAMVADD